MVGPTAFPDLNAVLRELVGAARLVLGENFCGAYLQGSFATRFADIFSDVDFIVVTHEELSGEQEAGLQAMHRRIYMLETPWAQHLEGSYVAASRLRRMDWSRSPFLYLDNGSDRLVFDSHCNTAVVRWLLREHGLALAGPEPRTLIDPVSAPDLQREAAARVHEYAESARESTEAGPMSRWEQSYLVITFCRLLFTLSEGRVASKGEAAAWALETLDHDWHGLIRRAVEDRPDPWERVYQLADPDLAQHTLQFGAHALKAAMRWATEQPDFE